MTNIAWHAISAEEALRHLNSSSAGLSEAEAAVRRVRYGPNIFRRVRPMSAWSVFAAQFRSLIVLLLVSAATIALFTRDPLDAAAIAAVLALNVAIGFATELSAHRAMEALLELDVDRAQVVRESRVFDVDARDLVPGDVIELEAGRTVPADARLLEAAELRVAEASLTGESVPVDKRATADLAVDVPLPDRSTMAYRTTSVVAGRARAVVVATGMGTEVGRIGTLAGGIAPKATPLERRLDALGRRLAGVAVAVAALVVGLGLLHRAPLSELLQTAIALAVAAVPEALPVVGTIAMAVGIRRMARRKALVRRLPVVETLGSATVICTDKTGTLTAGEMTVTVVSLPDREVTVLGMGYAPQGGFAIGGKPIDPAADSHLALALRIGVLANRGDIVHEGGTWQSRGDPTDAALVSVGRKAGYDRRQLLAGQPEIGEIPFSSERMLMATFHRRRPDEVIAYVKGAPLRVLERCASVLLPGDETRPLDDDTREALLRQNRALAARGLRVLALAVRRGGSAPGDDADLHGLTWVGLVGMNDPPAVDVAETIGAFREAGIRTVMLTGDQKLTAERVARQLAILAPDEAALDGRELEHLDDEALRDAVGRTTVFSRVSPEAKLRIVGAYQRRGDIVAMLGDGVNDAAALRMADIGVAMGVRGTDLAKEAAQVILEDDRFPTIGAAIEEGRVIFDNIRKFVFYLFSCNLAEILVLLGAGVAGFPLPLLPLQILWLNLLTDTVPALALAVEPRGSDIMRQPPRDPRAAILSKPMLRATVGYALLIAAASLIAFGWGLSGSAGALGRARTLAFMTLAFAQIFHLGNARSARPVTTLRRATNNPFALAAVALALGLQLLVMRLPAMADVLSVHPVSPYDWLVVVLLSVFPAVVGQVLKSVKAAQTRVG